MYNIKRWNENYPLQTQISVCINKCQNLANFAGRENICFMEKFEYSYSYMLYDEKHIWIVQMNATITLYIFVVILFTPFFVVAFVVEQHREDCHNIVVFHISPCLPYSLCVSKFDRT